MAFNPSKYKNNFAKENYDRIALNVPKGEKERLKQIAKQRGLSMTELIVKALEAYLEKDPE